MKFKRPYLAIVFIILFQTAISWADGIQFSNNATSALASGITAIATSLTVTTGEGALFPSITPPDYFMVTLVDTSGNKEIVKVTARSTDTLTIVRAREGTTGRVFASGSVVSNRLTAGSIDTINLGKIDALNAYGNGDTFTNATITAALTDLGTTNLYTLVLRSGTWTISSNVDWSAYTNVVIDIPCGTLLSHGAYTMDIAKMAAPHRCKIFDGSGAVTLHQTIFPEWHGALGDGSTDDQTAFIYSIASIGSGFRGEINIDKQKTYVLKHSGGQLAIGSRDVLFSGRGILSYDPTIPGDGTKQQFLTVDSGMLRMAPGLTLAGSSIVSDTSDHLLIAEAIGTTITSQAYITGISATGFNAGFTGYWNNSFWDKNILTFPRPVPEYITLDVAPGGAGWSVSDTITGVTSGSTSVITEKVSTTKYYIKSRDAAYTLGEVLTNGTATADQGGSYPTITAVSRYGIHFAGSNNKVINNKMTGARHLIYISGGFPEYITLDVAPGGAGWSVSDTITGNTSGTTSVILEKVSTTKYYIIMRTAAYTLGEVLTNGIATADQGASYPIVTSSAVEHNLVENNYVAGSQHSGITIYATALQGAARYNKVNHNVFDNCGTIGHMFDMSTNVQYNTFHGNTIYGTANNVLVNIEGAASTVSGYRPVGNVISDNIIINERANDTAYANIRILNALHTDILGNTLIRPLTDTSTTTTGILLDSQTTPNAYGNSVKNNNFIMCRLVNGTIDDTLITGNTFRTYAGTTNINIDGSGTAILTVNEVIVTPGTNTFNLTRGTAILDVAAASTVNIDGSLTVESASLVNQDLTTDASPTFTTVNAALSGNATTASSAAILTTARTIGGVSFDGSANITVETATNGFTLTGNAIGKRLLVSNGASPDGDSGIRIYAPISTTNYNWLIGAQHNVDSSFEITPSTAVGGTTFNTPGFLLDNAGIVTLGAYGAGTATFSAAGVISSDTTPDLGTPSAVVLTNGTGLPISTGVSDLGANIATFLATPSSANLATAITNETGSSLLVFNTSPTLVTPVLGAATGTSLATTGDITTSAGAIGIGDAAPDRPLVIEDSGAIIRMTREISDNAIFAPGILFERGRDAGADIVANDWLLKLTARGMVSGAYVNYSVLAVRATDTTNNAIWEFYDQDSVTLRASVDTNNGNIWAEGDVSALTFTDRTPFYEGNALSEIAKIKGKNGKIDHTTLPSFVHKVGKKIVYGLDGESKKMVAGEEDESRRDLGAMISMLTVAVQQLNDKIKILENKGN